MPVLKRYWVVPLVGPAIIGQSRLLAYLLGCEFGPLWQGPTALFALFGTMGTAIGLSVLDGSKK